MEFWVKVVLGKQDSSEELEFVRGGGDLEKELKKAQKHYCDLLFYSNLHSKELLGKELQQKMEINVKYNKAVIQNHTEKIRNYGKSAQELGVDLILIKGLAVSMLYPTPYLRRAGDIDVLLPKNKIRQFVAKTSPEKLKRNFFTAGHHNVQVNKESMTYLEVHKEVAWLPFALGLSGNNYEFIRKYSEFSSELGVYVPSIECSAYVLLLHIMNHWHSNTERVVVKNYIDLFYLAQNEKFNFEKLMRLVGGSKYSGVFKKILSDFVKFAGAKEFKDKFDLNSSLAEKVVLWYFIAALKLFRLGQNAVHSIIWIGKK